VAQVNGEFAWQAREFPLNLTLRASQAAQAQNPVPPALSSSTRRGGKRADAGPGRAPPRRARRLAPGISPAPCGRSKRAAGPTASSASGIPSAHAPLAGETAEPWTTSRAPSAHPTPAAARGSTVSRDLPAGGCPQLLDSSAAGRASRDRPPRRQRRPAHSFPAVMSGPLRSAERLRGLARGKPADGRIRLRSRVRFAIGADVPNVIR